MKPVRFEIGPSPDLTLVPRAPGVYLFRGGGEEVLYVGKAKELRRRLASYISQGARLSGKTALMVAKARTFEYILTETEKEALILEAALIKEYRPRYNIRLRDDKAYPFLCIETGHRFPRLSVQRRRSTKGEYFGPYPSAKSVRETLRFISATFGLRTCKDTSMRDRSRACIRFQIKRCCAPCIGAVSQEEYMRRVEEAKLFLLGKTAPLLSKLKKEMAQAADALEFERAAMLRDRIKAVQNVLERQRIISGDRGLWDVMALARDQDRVVVSVIQVREGTVVAQKVYELTVPEEESNESILSFFLRHFYLSAPVPEIVLVSVKPKERDLIAQWLSDIAHRAVKIHRPQRGNKFQLLSMGLENARQALERLESGIDAWKATEAALKEVLGTESTLDRVECVDISTTQGEAPVGSLVCFMQGRPYKKGYRHYNIRNVMGMDDYGMMEEVIRRRLKGALGRGDLPNLLVVDGGPGQLGTARKVVEELGLSGRLVLASIAKEARDEGEKIYVPGGSGPLMLPRHHPALLFFQKIRDEAHRFGITFHRKKRTRKGLQTILTDISGVGPRRQQALLQHFGSLTQLKRASVEEIARVKGIPMSLAKTIYRHLHQQGV